MSYNQYRSKISEEDDGEATSDNENYLDNLKSDSKASLKQNKENTGGNKGGGTKNQTSDDNKQIDFDDEKDHPPIKKSSQKSLNKIKNKGASKLEKQEGHVFQETIKYTAIDGTKEVGEFEKVEGQQIAIGQFNKLFS